MPSHRGTPVELPPVSPRESENPDVSSPETRGRGRHRAPRPRRRWLRRSLITLTVIVVLIAGGVVGDYYYLGSLVHHQVVKHLQTSSSVASQNILLIGSTSRCALTVQNPAYGLCSQGVNGVNSDIDMILHLDPENGSVSLLSIPRDLFVPNARQDGANKIDAALYEGPSQLVAAIEEDFAIPINHYVELNFDTFADVVNALGGVRMYFPVPVYDAESGLKVLHSGCILLNGYRALQVVRARHLQIQPTPSDTDFRSWPQEGLSDLARIRRTHEFLSVLAAKVASRGLGNPIADQSIATSVLPDLTVDSGFSEHDMVSLAEHFAHVNIGSAPQYTYPVTDVETGTYLYEGYYYGDVEFPVQPDAIAAVDKIFDVASGDNSFTGAALPAASSFKMTVEDGTASASQGTVVANQLTNLGFDVVSHGSVTPTGVVPETVVWYGGSPPPASGNWTSPSLAAAQKVLSELQGPAILGYDPTNVTPGALVTVVTGTGFTVTAHATSATTTTAVTGVTTTTAGTATYDPSGIATNPVFTAPSAVNPTLEPWDPRACNAAGTGPAAS